MACSPFLSMPR
ncbi:hypothetical protein Pint_22738 [Pistacia integerrima]|uniref:Uncharacterized protein n=1 Tax=Pistacia integerrima TaxID=434235 RepID=A0ACC0YK92_9ROSI|nr:hypothetical protein Pint_22738 [Pistacia integerrima]